MDDSKENDSSVIVNIQPSTPNRPLSGKNSMNSLNGANKSKGKIGSPSKAEVVQSNQTTEVGNVNTELQQARKGICRLVIEI